MRHKGEWISRSGGRAGVLIAAKKPPSVGSVAFCEGKALIYGLAIALIYGLAIALISGLAIALISGLAIAWISWLAIALIYGLAIALIYGLAIALIYGLAIALIYGLMIAWSMGWCCVDIGLIVAWVGGIDQLIDCNFDPRNT